MEPTTYSEEPDALEKDPLFVVFLNAVYNHAQNHPEELKDLSDIFDAEADKLLEGVDIHKDKAS